MHWRTSRVRTCLLFLLVLWAGAGVPGPASAQEIDRPWGVAALSSGELIVLETQGRMLRVSSKGRVVEVLARRFRPFFALDVTAVPTDEGEDTLFINLRFTTPQGTVFNRIRQYSLDGETIRQGWTSPSDSFAGIAVDPQRGILWLVEAASNEIHAVEIESLRGETKISPSRRLVRLPGNGILGPLAYDDVERTLFAADSLTGTLYAIPVGSSSPNPKQIAGELGEPQALAVDRRNRRLYVADAGGRRIWRLDLDGDEPKPELFAQPRGLRSPVGLSVAPDGTLWIADPEANRLVALGTTGELVRTVP